MSSLLRVALLLALSCLPSKADEQDVNRQDRTKNVGRGLLCDTSQQAERFVTLRNDGKDAEVALQNVNEEAHKSNACGIALVVFTGGEPIAHQSIRGRPVAIVPITVHAISNGAAWKEVPPLAQYAVVVEEGAAA